MDAANANDLVETRVPCFDDMTPKQVRERGQTLSNLASEHGEIRATLIVNCMPGRPLHELGITYDESKRVLSNLAHILEQLIFKAGNE